jgi:hypothetical protein
MKYATEMGAVAMMCIPSFIKISSSIQKLIKGIHRHTDIESMETAEAYFIFQNKKSRLKMMPMKKC